MARFVRPEEIRAELGLRERPFPLNAYRKYLGVVFVERDVRSGGMTTWRQDRITVLLPPGGSRERKRQDGSHELGHVANGDLGPHQPVIYRRGSRRGTYGLDPRIEDRATNWGVDALIGRGPLGIAINHEEIKSVHELAHEFVVTPRFMAHAVARYELKPFVVRDEALYARYLASPEWSRTTTQVLAARPVCERSACHQLAVTVVHRRFDVLGREGRQDVEALCSECAGGIRLGFDAVRAQLRLFDGDGPEAAS